MSEELVNVPQDLRLVSDEELPQLEAQAVSEFDRLNAEDDVTPETLEQLTNLRDGIKRIRTELSVRDARSKKEAEEQRAKLLAERQQLQSQVHGASAEDGAIITPSETGGSVDAEAVAAATAKGVTAALLTVIGDNGTGRDLTELTKRATASLADASRFTPKIKVPHAQLAVTAAVDIPGLARGTELNNVSALAEAMHRRARSMTIARGDGPRQLVATVRNEFEHTVDDRTKPSQVEELFRFLTSDDRKEALVAGGGWCAPSEIRYDFFNIACEDGLIDLPTFGVSRGGVQFPVSPSLGDADFYGPFDNAGNPWLWTEDDDINAATGSTPRKPCIRVPCPTFDEERLECYGVCVTAGNLTDDAYPEATQNFIRLMMTMHTKEINRRIISLMAAASSPIISGDGFAIAGPAFNQLYSGLELAAIDYREKYGMCETDVLEVVLPRWIVGVLRADLARRTGVLEELSITRQRLVSYFADRGIRIQLVADWQTRGTGQFGQSTPRENWPASVDAMIYAAGTFLLGNGLTLDLGVVRDSTLNATNDHTAAWTEECKLLAKVGHESRQYRITYDVLGDPPRVGTAATLDATQML